jgi:hypothetical protein
MAAGNLPVLIVGDVHGDIERLFAALEPYPADQWHTIFLGDLVDYGMFGVGALRFARDRENTEVLLGNHEVAMLWALRDPTRVGWWIGLGGQEHDLAELRTDDDLQHWMRARPALLRLGDRTLAQHCGSDIYLDLSREGAADQVAAINSVIAVQLETGGERLLWDLLSSPNVFETQRPRLEHYLERMNSRRVVFGHKPHRQPRPAIYHDGRAINFDGGLSRSHLLHQRSAPLSAAVGPLDPS